MCALRVVAGLVAIFRATLDLRSVSHDRLWLTWHTLTQLAWWGAFICLYSIVVVHINDFVLSGYNTHIKICTYDNNYPTGVYVHQLNARR